MNYCGTFSTLVKITRDKDSLVEKLDAFIDIHMKDCTIREVGTYMKVVFYIEDEGNWMLHSLPE
jgi:hypothetical protein